MTFITDGAFDDLLTQDEPAEDRHKAQGYVHVREEAAEAMLSTEPRIFGSRRLARLLGVAARLEREVKDW